MAQTAVEWFIQQVSEKEPNGFYFIDILEDVERIFEQAKQIEKEQHVQTWNVAHQAGRFEGKGIAEENWQTFEQYYNETYKTQAK